jgi:hypothetical protein
MVFEGYLHPSLDQAPKHSDPCFVLEQAAPMRLLFEIRRRLIDTGVDAVVVERAIAGTVVEVWIRATRTDSFALGQSRIGGAPDLPRGAAWPRHRWPRTETATWPDYAQTELATAIASGVVIEEPDHIALALPFVAQLDLAELAPHQELLPRRGYLWLFADQSTTLGEIGGYPYCASACLYAEDAELVATEPVPVSDGALPAFALHFMTERVLPDAGDLGLAGDDWYRYEKGRKDLAQPEPRHACLIRAQYGSMAFVPPEGHVGLLRVDSDYADDYTLNWGDAAWITFAIPTDALAAKRFDEVRAFRWIG